MRVHRSNIQIKIAPMERMNKIEIHFFGAFTPSPFSHHKEKEQEIVLDYICESYRNNNLNRVTELKGRYIIFIQDFQNEKTVIINDTFGSIPIYFNKSGQSILVANDLRFFNNHCPIELNLLHEFSQSTHDKVYLKECFLKYIYLIAGNTILTIDHNNLNYSFQDKTKLFFQEDTNTKTEHENVQQYRQLLLKSINEKVNEDSALTLSGGLDSSILLQLTPTEKINHLYSLCTISSIDNNEIQRAIELSQLSDIGQDIYPFNFVKPIMLQHWDESIISTMNPEGGVEVYSKYLLAKMISQSLGPGTNVITGLASDHFNGGHTMTDYNKGMLHNSWDDFFLQLKVAFNNKDQDYNELLDILEYKHHDRYIWHEYLTLKHNGMMSGSLLKEYTTERHFQLNYICPFLDEELIKFVASIPPVQYPSLFFNKNILRLAGQSALPKSFAQTQKVKPNNSLIHQVVKLYNTFLLRNKTQIAKRISNSTLLNNVINTDNILYLIKNLSIDNLHGNLSYNIIKLYNFALLGDYVLSHNSDEYKTTNLCYTNTQDINEITKMVDHNTVSDNEVLTFHSESTSASISSTN